MNADPLATVFLERLNAAVKRKVTVTLIGGNALSALGLKQKTKDIDIVARSTEKEVIAFCKEYPQKYKVQVEVFIDGFFKNVKVTDYLDKAIPVVATQFPNITLKLLGLHDIILTKTMRFEEKDQEDIENILLRENIKRTELDSRFKYYLQHFLGRLTTLALIMRSY